MNIDEARKLLGAQTLDDVTAEGPDGELFVTFSAILEGERFSFRVLTLFISGDRFRVGSSSCSGSRDLLVTADAYARAASFIRRAALRPE